MMGGACYLGVDGGGTKTRFVLIDADARPLAQVELGTTYVPQVGLDGARAVLARGIADVLDASGCSPADIAWAFFGLPAHGEDSRITGQLDALPFAILGHRRYACGNDMLCGWAGSLACADGINIVAGTGSIGYGQRNGREARAGGWGEVFSDEGSAHWIAIRGLNTYSRMSDGRLPKGPLHAIVNAAFGLQRDLDLCAHVYGEGAGARSDIARLSKLVAEAARQGDAEALRIYRDAGAELAAIADALRIALGFDAGEHVPVSWSGGAFSAGELLLAPFRDGLHAACPGFELRAPLHEPHIGAALYAMRHPAPPQR